MTWHNVKEIRIREHVAKGRPGSRPCLMISYTLEGHADCFDHLAFDSDKQFAKDKAASRWLDLRGEEPIPVSTAEALEREAELQVPLRILVTMDGQWERVNEVDFEGEPRPELDVGLTEDKAFLEEITAPKKVTGDFDFSKWRS